MSDKKGLTLDKVDESKYTLFDDIIDDELRKHQKDKHADFFEFHEKEQRREAAPGDVTIF